MHFALVDVGRDVDRGEVRPGHGLQPDGLPDAGDGRVPDAMRLLDLLAARLRSLVAGVPDADDDFLLALRLQGSGDVEVDRVVTALVLAGLLAVDPDDRVPVDGAEVQQQALGLADLRGEGTA